MDLTNNCHKLLVVITFCLYFTTISQCRYFYEDTRSAIINGLPSNHNDHYVLVVINDSAFCGGVVVNHFWILTAASCVIQKSSESIYCTYIMGKPPPPNV